ncbi:O-fucosyltransferase 9 [Benincasa hispida]|uniref:O-fucosyltransferase 9 n=1 Tax=Benincasa hispida TaxID=102211 RepID=UPI0019024E64|nr:O-fucosyltransferase 9 [Benincasa hispida]
MHGYSRLNTSRSSVSLSPPASPRHRQLRSRSGSDSGSGTGGFSVRDQKQSSIMEKLVFLILSAVFRRKGLLLFAPLLYISMMLLYMGSLNFDVSISNLKTRVVSVNKRPPPGSVYRSPQVFEKLWPFMEAESRNSTTHALSTAWNSRVHHVWKPCISRSTMTELPKSNGFLIIEANGGLNQQRLSICDAVAVAGLLNASLVIPIFHLNSVWRDSSKFGDIFDEDFFIQALSKHVNIVRELPADVLQQYDNNISSIVNLRVKAWSSPMYYLHKVLPKLLQLRAVRIAPFSNRLAHGVPSDVQALRCLANFEALRFAESIRVLADLMVYRMIKKSSQSGGKYISVHLRFEEDMVAFSCCEYNGGEEEKHEMDLARERSWRGKFRRRGRVIRPGVNRVDGKCPLTPLEVGMMLRGMGFDNTTSIYVAAGKIYKAEKYMAPLRQMFPRLETKDTIATKEELAPFKGHSSRLAALDYTVCLHSEVFVTTQGGNFPHFLMGHRRYIYAGHAKTVKPDKRKLALIFDDPNIRWQNFAQQMQDMLRHNDQKGMEMKKPSGSLYTFPMPDCMCKVPNTKNHD